MVAALKRKFHNIAEPKKGDICYATTNRQEAVKFIAPQVDVVIVVGSPNSSDLDGKLRIGVTAGASSPNILIQGVVDRLREYGAKSVRVLERVREAVIFPLLKGVSPISQKRSLF